MTIPSMMTKTVCISAAPHASAKKQHASRLTNISWQALMVRTSPRGRYLIVEQWRELALQYQTFWTVGWALCLLCKLDVEVVEKYVVANFRNYFSCSLKEEALES